MINEIATAKKITKWSKDTVGGFVRSISKMKPTIKIDEYKLYKSVMKW